MNYFLRHGSPGDLCVLMDGDNTHDPVDVHSRIQKLGQGYDVVIASRYQGGAEVHGVPRPTACCSAMAPSSITP